MEKIKVAYIINDLLIGGAQRIIFDTCSLINKNEFEIVVIYYTDHESFGRANFVRDFKEKGIRTICLNPKVAMISRYKNFLSLYKTLKYESPDIVHIFLPDAVIFGVLASRLLGLKKIIVHEMNSHGFFSKKLHYFFEIARYFSRISIFYSESLEKESFSKSNFLSGTIQKADFTSCTILDGINTEDINKKIAEVDRVITRSSLGVSQNEIMILSVARLIDWKGQQKLVRAFSIIAVSHPSIKLFIAGDGPAKEDIEEEILRIKDEGVRNRIIMLGSRNDAYELMYCADIFSLAIEYPVGFESISLGMSSMEALAIGVPSIASEYKDLYSGIEHRKNVILVKPGDVLDLAHKISELIVDKELRKTLSVNSRHYVENNFSAKNITKIYESLYKAL